MEQAQYWMWLKRRDSLNSHDLLKSNYSHGGDSWEEKAFAQDASGPYGGCVWPPRSYTCSFCRREFRSAQALGGHMNVHRRDRARLKQSPSPRDHQSVVLNPKNSLSIQDPSQMYSMKSNEKTFVPLFSSPIIEDRHKKPSYAHPSWPSLLGDRYSRVLDLNNEDNNSKLFLGSSSAKVKKDYVTADLSVSLNLVVRRTGPTSYGGEKRDDISFKRRRITNSTLSPSESAGRDHVKSEVLELSSSSEEDWILS
ncbi:hypothetical protein NMG60_11000331 [Bertholletia excelsa]